MMIFTGRHVGHAPRRSRPERPIVHGPRPAATIALSLRKDSSMALDMHSASVPIFVRMLGNLVTWLDKAEAHATAKKFEPSVYLTARLAPDMLPLPTQIQIARLAGSEGPAFPDDEKTLADLRQRVTKTIDYLKSVPAAQIIGSDAKEISVPRRAGPITMSGEAYLKYFALPNFFFHVTTTYALLRH